MGRNGLSSPLSVLFMKPASKPTSEPVCCLDCGDGGSGSGDVGVDGGGEVGSNGGDIVVGFGRVGGESGG